MQAFTLENGVPGLDSKLMSYVAAFSGDSLWDLVQGALRELEQVATEAPLTLHSANLCSPSLVARLAEDTAATNMAKVGGGAILLYAQHHNRDLTAEEINSIFSDTVGAQVNFSFPTVALAPNGEVEMVETPEGNLWPQPFVSAQGVCFETRWIAGDKQFPVLCMDKVLGSKIGWYIPISARVPDEHVAAVAVETDLPGVLFELRASLPDSDTPPTKAFYFHPRAGWGDRFLGPVGFMDCGEGAAVFASLNPAYTALQRSYPRLCGFFDHRLFKTVWHGEKNKVKLHRNMEIVALSPVPNSKQVTLAPAGGYQCHATLCGAGDSDEIAKFCLSRAGHLYPVPCNPFAKGAAGEMLWPHHYLIDKMLPTMFYAFAHVGEQTSYSRSHARMHPSAFQCYSILNAARDYLQESPCKRARHV